MATPTRETSLVDAFGNKTSRSVETVYSAPMASA